jgi:hypothetical protein
MTPLLPSVCLCSHIEGLELLTLSDNPLSISKISSNTNLVECSFTGVDGSFTTVDGAVSSDVGPPQTQVSGTCFKLQSQRRRSRDVAITFIGAAGAQFTQSFPIDDTVQTISELRPDTGP